MSSLARQVLRWQTAFGSLAASSVRPSSPSDGLFSLHSSFGLTDVAHGKMRAVSAQGARDLVALVARGRKDHPRPARLTRRPRMAVRVSDEQ